MRRRRGYAGYGYRRRRRGKKVLIAALAGILLGIVLLLAATVVSLQSALRRSKVSGNTSHYTTEEIEQVIDLVLGGKSVQKFGAYCYYENRFREHKIHPVH